ncbi:two-component response regulator (plasmid) [Ketogulonicigenium vulgare Y25]|uniref:RNA polymerase, sigma-24 subunit, ECF subfamily protein n=1 Tax=Ketogulonicigenium vulgare (strain WSH-001) TaxID=759362 RepID=F9YBN7_KETVW|nr:response regulator [Ketogulonicigenium vulgare]ADO44356.1 two-component response regulator [Ketogulonicigenium vulgare Y25]AEM42789.1 RNA polymerase, sigma-24 subunit, ECF subfamily protein [Ketogulonicigenium vulgare WSH-001]ALJ82774.1 two-component response regulator [Ketogulonicigenium vulgare]
MSEPEHTTSTSREAPRVENSMAMRVAAELPFLRRYARALTGSQESGDKYAAVTIEALLEDRSLLDPALSPRIVLFRTFHSVWQSSGRILADAATTMAEKRALARLAGLTSNTREALLLFTVEEFSREDIAQIMQIDADQADALLKTAYVETLDTIKGRVMIIEDEPLIAMDIRAIVEEMGHEVVGVATTRAEAEALGRDAQPDLILSDINLADKSSGIDAVNTLLAELGAIPTIFITAFPEKLLTGERPEPAFLITKPFTEERVRSAVSQAMFFASTETLSS